MENIILFPLTGIPSVKQGDHIASLILEQLQEKGVEIQEGDLLVIAHKVVSKAQGRTARLSDVVVSAAAEEIAQRTGKPGALVQLMIDESQEITVTDRGVLLCRRKDGWVCANAAIDLSNSGDRDTAILLPLDTDAAAFDIAQDIYEQTGENIAVIISDTHGRPCRNGITGVAVGVYGLEPIKSYIGLSDLDGQRMEVSKEAVADELAAAATLLMGQGSEGIPAVLIRGYQYQHGESNSQPLKRSKEQELFQPIGDLYVID